jgi:hypothetical protein
MGQPVAVSHVHADPTCRGQGPSLIQTFARDSTLYRYSRGVFVHKFVYSWLQAEELIAALHAAINLTRRRAGTR